MTCKAHMAFLTGGPTACILHLFGRPAATPLQMMLAETEHLQMMHMSGLHTLNAPGAFYRFGMAAVHCHTYHTLLLNCAR